MADKSSRSSANEDAELLSRESSLCDENEALNELLLDLHFCPPPPPLIPSPAPLSPPSDDVPSSGSAAAASFSASSRAACSLQIPLD
eukprot:PDM66440.1 hypothetical protein PRIPAC_47857 [Pristionchus pacificus]